jgi:hypothetical protein
MISEVQVMLSIVVSKSKPNRSIVLMVFRHHTSRTVSSLHQRPFFESPVLESVS